MRIVKKTLSFFVLFVIMVGFFIHPVEAVEIPWGSPHTIASAFNGASDVEMADIDGDGDLDILAAAKAGHDIAWWENTTGDGSTWSKHLVDNHFLGADSVQAVDINLDGALDVLCVGYDGNDVAWWENINGDGLTWTIHNLVSDFEGGRGVTAADIDGDGDWDVVGAAQEDNDITWWKNAAGNGSTWGRQIIDLNFEGAWGVYTADLDHDGDMDVLGASQGGDGFAWWENTAGDGIVWAKKSIDSTLSVGKSVYAADMDGDGDLDVLGAAPAADTIVWWENSAGDASTWDNHYVNTDFDGARDVVAADMDNDGDMDILGAAENADTISWWENLSGDGLTWTQYNLQTNFDGASSVTAADVDGDGDMDVLGTAFNADDVTWWENNSIHRTAYYTEDKNFEFNQPFPVDGNGTSEYAEPKFFSSADFNGDGLMDILGSYEAKDFPNSKSAFVWFNDDSPLDGYWRRIKILEGYHEITDLISADVDGDGDMDVIYAGGYVTGSSGRKIVLVRNDMPYGWHEYAIVTHIRNPHSLSAVDLDHDGDLDIAAVAGFTNDEGVYGMRLVWYENDGTPCDGEWEFDYFGFSTYNPDNFGLDVQAGDINGDGYADLIYSYHTDPYFGWLYIFQNNQGTIDKNGYVRFSILASKLSLGDVDRDGDLDIIAVEDDDPMPIRWFENINGDGKDWEPHLISASFKLNSLFFEDFDQDGDGDVLTNKGWFENVSGDGLSWDRHEIKSTVVGVFPADLDQDGDMDVISFINPSSRAVPIIQENVGGQFGLETSTTAPPVLEIDQIEDVLQVTMTHLGRSGDSPEEFASMDLLFEGCYGRDCALLPLTTGQAGELFDELRFYLDDGDGVFDIDLDTMVSATVQTFSLVDGVQTIHFNDGGGNLRVDYGSPQTYFVVLDRAGTAPSNPTVSRFRLTHITENGSTAEDRVNDIPLKMQYAPNQSSDSMEIPCPPQANDDAGDGFTTVIGSPFTTASVLENDFDPNGDTLSIENIDTSGLLGLLTSNEDGTFNYDPNGQFGQLMHGEQANDTFTYTISDGAATDTATVTITIFGEDNAPIANNDAGTGFETGEDTVFTTGNVLTNDTDADGDPLIVIRFDTTGLVGSVTNNGDGTFNYDPNGQWNDLDTGETASDLFTYTISDGRGGYDSATVTITVNGINDAPIAEDDYDPEIGFVTDEDTAFITGSVLGNDDDPEGNLSVISFDPSFTSGVVTNNGDGTFSYDPNGQFNYLGTDQSETDAFTYTISDGEYTAAAAVIITIVGINDAPDAVDDSGIGFNTDPYTVFNTANVLDNDLDPEGDTFGLESFDTTGTLGVVTNNGDGSFSYDPNGQFDYLLPDESATDQFTYTVSAENGGFDTAAVTILITGKQTEFRTYLPLMMR